MEKKKKVDQFQFTENVTFERIDKKTGKVLSIRKKSNIVTNNGLEAVVKSIIPGFSIDDFKYIAIGESATGAQDTDSALLDEVAREEADVTYEGNGKIKFVKRFSFGSGEAYEITEAGILNAPSNGVLLNRVVDAEAYSVDDEVDLTVTIEITAGRPV
jgi:hypothetical protein